MTHPTFSEIAFDPPLRSRHHLEELTLEGEDSLHLYFVARCRSIEPELHAPRLQIWTDLPTATAGASESDRDRDGAWRAHDFAPAPSPSLGAALVCALRIDAHAAAPKHASTYSFTYRYLHADGRIEWCGTEEDDGRVILGPRDAGDEHEQPLPASPYKAHDAQPEPMSASSRRTTADTLPSRRSTLSFVDSAGYRSEEDRDDSSTGTVIEHHELDADMDADVGDTTVLTEYDAPSLPSSPAKKSAQLAAPASPQQSPAARKPGASDAEARDATATAAAAPRARIEPTPEELLIAYGPLVALRAVLVLVVSAAVTAVLLSAPARVLPGIALRVPRAVVARALRAVAPAELDDTQVGALLREALVLDKHVPLRPWISSRIAQHPPPPPAYSQAEAPADALDTAR